MKVSHLLENMGRSYGVLFLALNIGIFMPYGRGFAEENLEVEFKLEDKVFACGGQVNLLIYIHNHAGVETSIPALRGFENFFPRVTDADSGRECKLTERGAMNRDFPMPQFHSAGNSEVEFVRIPAKNTRRLVLNLALFFDFSLSRRRYVFECDPKREAIYKSKENTPLKFEVRMKAEIDEIKAIEKYDPLAEKVGGSDYESLNANPPHSIEIAAAKSSFSLGSSPVKVEFKTDAVAKESWNLPKPDVHRNNLIIIQERCNPVTQRRFRAGHCESINRAGPFPPGAVGLPSPTITVAPGKAFSFALDITALPYNWRPGKYDIWISSIEEKSTSNKLEFAVEATSDSFELLVEMVSSDALDKNPLEKYQTEIRRDFAIRWLGAAFYDLPLNRITDKDDTDVYSAKMAQNARLSDLFRQSWPKIKSSPEFSEVLRKMNSGEKWDPIRSRR